MLLTAGDYRPSLLSLRKFAELPCPKIVITASLPPDLRKVLLGNLDLFQADLLHEPTNRTNIR